MLSVASASTSEMDPALAPNLLAGQINCSGGGCACERRLNVLDTPRAPAAAPGLVLWHPVSSGVCVVTAMAYLQTKEPWLHQKEGRC